jgi:hypothetical protein
MRASRHEEAVQLAVASSVNLQLLHSNCFRRKWGRFARGAEPDLPSHVVQPNCVEKKGSQARCSMPRLAKQTQIRSYQTAGQEVTYHVGLRLAVVALGVEAVTLALGGGGLEVRWNCTGGHVVCVWECEVE